MTNNVTFAAELQHRWNLLSWEDDEKTTTYDYKQT